MRRRNSVPAASSDAGDYGSPGDEEEDREVGAGDAGVANGIVEASEKTESPTGSCTYISVRQRDELEYLRTVSPRRSRF